MQHLVPSPISSRQMVAKHFSLTMPLIGTLFLPGRCASDLLDEVMHWKQLCKVQEALRGA